MQYDSLESEEAKIAILDLSKKNFSGKQIARITGLSKSSINRFIAKDSWKEWWALREEIVPKDNKVVKRQMGDQEFRFPIVTSNQPPAKSEGNTHFVIPDTQAKPGVCFKYMNKIGQYIANRKPEVIVHLGDHYDLPSLSSYDKGSRKAEGRRLHTDLEAGLLSMEYLLKPIHDLQQKEIEEYGEIRYKPYMVLTLGNHEQRLERHVNANPELFGFVDYESFRYSEMGWDWYDFLDPVIVDGVTYCHFMANPFSGKPYGGSCANILKHVGESFTCGHKQTLDVTTRFLPSSGQQQWGIVAGACLEKSHKVLKADLTYVPLGDIVAGDKLVSFQEHSVDKRSRRYKTGTVKAVKHKDKETFKVSLESGKHFVVTEDHQWFVRTGSTYRWVETSGLRKGTCIPRLLPEFEKDFSYDSGWLSGMYDGEGSLYQRKTTGGTVVQMAICQASGETNEKLKKALWNFTDYSYTEAFDERKQNRVVSQYRVKGGIPQVIKLLGTIRPERLISKFSPDHMGSICCPSSNNDKVVSIEPVGINTVVEIDIDCKTMIVEGYGHHNCYEHLESYKGIQGNKHWRGVVVKHNVKGGTYNPMFVDLDYINRKYKSEFNG